MDAVDRPADLPQQPGDLAHADRVLRSLWKARRTLVVTAMACAGVAGAVSLLVPPAHRAEMRIRIGVDAGDKPLRSASALAAELSSLARVEALIGGRHGVPPPAVLQEDLRGLKASVSEDGRTVLFLVAARKPAMALQVAAAIGREITGADAQVLAKRKAQRQGEIADLRSLYKQIEAAGLAAGSSTAGVVLTRKGTALVPADPAGERWNAMVRIARTIATLQSENLPPSVVPTRVVFGPEPKGRGRLARGMLAAGIGLVAGLFAAMFLVLASDALERRG